MRLLVRIVMLCMFPLAVRAQLPVPPAPPVPAAQLPAPAVDSLAGASLLEVPPPFALPNGALLRVATLVYNISLLREGLPPLPLGVRTVSVTEATLAGAPGWLIAESRRGTAVGTTDSLFLSRSTLAPTRWTATIGAAQLAASITLDTAYGASMTYQGRSSFTVALPRGVLLTPGMAERMMELLPWRTDYRASATLLLVEMGAPRALPAELLLEREEAIDLFGRREECWVVVLRAGPSEERLWITKVGANVVRMEQVVHAGTLLSELTR